MSRACGPGKQQGAALFVSLVLLVAMAWFALSAFRISGQHLQLVGNSEVQHQAAAQQATASDWYGACWRQKSPNPAWRWSWSGTGAPWCRRHRCSSRGAWPPEPSLISRRST